MTTFKTALLAATALAVMSGAAMAQSAGGNQAFLNSTGNDNRTDVQQTSALGTGNLTNSDLTGNNNNVLVIQNNPNSDGRAIADIDVAGQSGGSFNTIEIRQTAFNESRFSADDKFSTVDVFGDGNRVITNQQFGAASEPNRSTVTIRGDDEGRNNNVEVFQTNNGQLSNALVWGDNNRVNVSQVAGGSRSFLTIDGGTAGGDDGEGDNNTITVNQASGGSHLSTLTVYGDGNTGTVTQNGSSNEVNFRVGNTLLDGDNNLFNLSQSGSGNLITGDIVGNNNTALIVQTGTNNRSNSSQLGDFNLVNVSQTGTANVSNVSQNGNGNSTFVVQN